MRRFLALFLLSLALAFGQAIQPTDNPSQINVSTGWLYLNKMHYAGTWSALTTYNNQDVVTYSGSTYVSNGVGNLGVNPSLSTVWWTQLGGSSSGGFTNPMSAQYDLIQGGTAGAATALHLGANGTALGASGNVGGYYTIPTLLGYTPPNPGAANAWTGGFLQDFSAAKFKPSIATVSTLPSAASSANLVYLVPDGVSVSDCTTGGGSNGVWCRSNGTAWVNLGGGSGGGGSGNVNAGGTLTSTEIVTGAGSTNVQTPSANATVDASGNLVANSFSTPNSGVGYLDLTLGASPGDPASGKGRLYIDSTSGNVTCINSTGGNCNSGTIPSTVVQTNQSNAYTSGTQDFSLVSHFVTLHGTAASKPGTCTLGEVYFATDATAGQNWYFCTATNTWNQQVSGGGGGAATSLVDGGGNTAMGVIQGSGTIVNQLSVQDAPTTVNPQLAATGSDTNIALQLTPKGNATVFIPTTGLGTSGSSPAMLTIGTPFSNAGFGALFEENLPSGASSAEFFRFANNGTWDASLIGAGLYLSQNTALNVGASSSGSTGRANISNVAQFLGYSLGYFGLCSSSSTASSCDTGLARTTAGIWEVNNGVSGGGGVVANLRDMNGRAFGTELTNNSGGTTNGLLVKLVTSSGASQLVNATTSDTTGVVGVLEFAGGTSGSGVFMYSGVVTCTFDGATTAGDYVQISSTTAANCHDASSSLPGSGQIIGRVLTTNASSGGYQILMNLQR